MEELNTPIFAQAKVEYTAQLIDILYPHIFDGVKSIYNESKILYTNKRTPVLLIFRELLEKVPIWNSEIINSECSRIINNSNCDYIDDLITAVFISHTKILTSIGPNQSFNKINVTIPKCSTFIHKSYINTAREIWKNPYLFNESVPGHEFQKNNKEIENIIKTCIENTIRKLLPIKEILKEHLESENDSNILNQRETLKQMLREELSGLKSNSVSYETVVKEEEDDNDSDEINENDISEKDSIGPTIIKELEGEDTNEEPNGEPNEVDNEITNQGANIVYEREEDEITELENKLSDMVEKIETESDKEMIQTLPEDQSNDSSELFPSSEDPTEDQVNAQCSDIVVNDITVPVEIPGEEETQTPVVEIKYDNVDINKSDEPEVDPERLKRLMTNMEVKEEVNVIKSDEVATFENQNTHKQEPQQASHPEPEPEPQLQPEPEPEIPSQPRFTLNSLYPTMNNEELPKVEVVSKEDNNDLPIEEKPVATDEIKSPRKEMVSVQNEDDIDETSSLANFFDDMKQIVEDKGIKVEKNENKMFTLFEDANEVEKI
uniref:Uncharacterized protein n=1 Tax=viral metagenome TaxID=1070528 RepID=A0A6C0FBQ9_9ZZZZ|tara:strand:+ start:16663 stop:18312 length:1650 start_codon:yes stop_codon:yes gene_type:complete